MTIKEAQRIADDCFRGHGDRYSQRDLILAEARLQDSGRWESALMVEPWIQPTGIDWDQ